jgi:hypothetical protein
MKKLMTLMLGMSLVLGTTAVFAQEKKDGEKKEGEKKGGKKGGKKKG